MKKGIFFEVLPSQWQHDVKMTSLVTKHLTLWATQTCHNEM